MYRKYTEWGRREESSSWSADTQVWRVQVRDRTGNIYLLFIYCKHLHLVIFWRLPDSQQCWMWGDETELTVQMTVMFKVSRNGPHFMTHIFLWIARKMEIKLWDTVNTVNRLSRYTAGCHVFPSSCPLPHMWKWILCLINCSESWRRWWVTLLLSSADITQY